MSHLGSFRRSTDAVEAVWTSLMPRIGIIENCNEDEDVMKLSLLLKSTQLLLTGLKQKQQHGLSEVNSLKAQLQAVTRQKDQYETDAKNLQKELSAIKFELHSSDSNMKKFQKEAETATLKWKQLQSTISSEVENRLSTIFKTCLQQNKAVTVQEMMTQLQTQPQVTEFPKDEWPAARVQRVAELIAGKETSQPRTPSTSTNLRDISPDKSLILDTPDAGERSAFQRHKSNKNDCDKPNHFAAIINSVNSSPDEIAPTPPSANSKQESKRRGKSKRIFSRDKSEAEKDDGKKPIVYAVDTQDITELGNERPALKENIIIPETLEQENCEEEIQHRPPSRRDKENCLTATVHHQKNLSPDTSTNAESLSTPQKAQKPRDSSPIFNSGSKKNGARPSNTSLSSSSKKPRLKSSSFQSANAVDIGYRKTENGRFKMTVQPTLHSVVTNMNVPKLNTSKSNRPNSRLSLKQTQIDTSKRLDFKQKKPTDADLSKSMTHLSEEEQIELAISRSRLENYSGLTDDSDATMFEPNGLAPITEKSLHENVKSAVNSSTSLKGRHDSKDNAVPYFEPMYASTEKEHFTPAKLGKVVDSHEGTLPSQFKPPFASTQKKSMGDSALNELVELLDDENLDDTAPHPVENSYNHLPRNYINKGRALKKHERKNLPALECTQCGRYFAAAFGDDEKARREIVHHCSRHRDRTGAGARPATPPGYWEIGWHSPQDANKAQEV